MRTVWVSDRLSGDRTTTVKAYVTFSIILFAGTVITDELLDDMGRPQAEPYCAADALKQDHCVKEKMQSKWFSQSIIFSKIPMQHVFAKERIERAEQVAIISAQLEIRRKC